MDFTLKKMSISSSVMSHLMRSLGSTRPIGPTICRFAAVGDGGGGCRGGGGGPRPADPLDAAELPVGVDGDGRGHQLGGEEGEEQQVARVLQPGSMHDTSVLYNAIKVDETFFPHPPQGIMW